MIEDRGETQQTKTTEGTITKQQLIPISRNKIGQLERQLLHNLHNQSAWLRFVNRVNECMYVL